MLNQHIDKERFGREGRVERREKERYKERRACQPYYYGDSQRLLLLQTVDHWCQDLSPPTGKTGRAGMPRNNLERILRLLHSLTQCPLHTRVSDDESSLVAHCGHAVVVGIETCFHIHSMNNWEGNYAVRTACGVHRKCLL